MKSDATVKLKSVGSRWEVTLVPAERKPFLLSESVIAQLEAHFRKIEKGVASGQSPSLVVLQGESPRCFCAGADIRILKGLNRDSIVPWVTRGHEVLNQIEDCPLTVVAKVQGYALGGGLELAMACDLIYADSTAVFGQTEAKIGMIPGWGGTVRLPERIGAAKAKKLLATGEMIDARSANELGLLDYFNPDTGIDAAIDELEALVARNGSVAVSAFKKILNDERAEARKRCLSAEIAHSIDCIENTDTKARISEFVRPKPKSA